MTPSRPSPHHNLAPGPGGGARGGAPPCLERRCLSPAKRPCMWQSANTWSEIGAKLSPWSRPSMRRAATAALSSIASVTASATPSTSPGISEKRKAPFSLAPSASPRNSPPWWSHSTVLSYSHPPRRKESHAWSSVVAYPSTWIKSKGAHSACHSHAESHTQTTRFLLGLNLEARRTSSCFLAGGCLCIEYAHECAWVPVGVSKHQRKQPLQEGTSCYCASDGGKCSHHWTQHPQGQGCRWLWPCVPCASWAPGFHLRMNTNGGGNSEGRIRLGTVCSVLSHNPFLSLLSLTLVHVLKLIHLMWV